MNFEIFQVGSNDEDMLLIGEKVYNFSSKAETLFLEADEGFRKLKTENFAIFCEGVDARINIPNIFLPHEICGTRRILFPENTVGGILVKKNFPMRERLLINWLWYSEIGIVAKINNHWLGTGLHCESRSHFEQIDLQYVAPALIFLILFYCFTLHLLCTEIYLAKFRKN